MKTLIIGAGKIGKAIQSGFKPDVGFEFWDKDSSKVENQRSIEDAVASADVVFLCVPSTCLFEAVNSLKEHVKANTFVVSLTKGIESNTSKFAAEFFPEYFSKENFALLSGPMLADELIAGKKGSAVVASANTKIFEALKNTFRDDFLNLEYSSDVYSVSMSGVLKNIYTIALGIADGLGFGKDQKGELSSRAISEAMLVIKELSGDPEVFLGTAGVADFVATSTSSDSMNFKAGKSIAEGKEYPVSEGVHSLSFLVSRLKDITKFPLLNSINEILLKKRRPQDLI
ncbi:MAG: glycerol-3-phosphate dehydrogenase (NAD(P)+) [Candidatus Doudnabacteria bacterium Gr01-1014_77]|uniref:Glycerol-3-phosphate dehydrogenase (NAD(P)+) n=1 Tax=Candidatus Doudnabacteria bacterium Gr01-1014_77 TaxID=2017133 RepID=A0A554JAT2_9BACT|nr:MAG: glycerol-3-phosphate dehydrogenase (NAD(P)+) [Candidatus Doudnabacteria bacterium Gr01-1014_77]